MGEPSVRVTPQSCHLCIQSTHALMLVTRYSVKAQGTGPPRDLSIENDVVKEGDVCAAFAAPLPSRPRSGRETGASAKRWRRVLKEGCSRGIPEKQPGCQDASFPLPLV